MTTETAVRTLQNFVAGAWQPAAAEGYDDVPNPATGDVLARVPLSSGADVDAAVRAAAAANNRGRVDLGFDDAAQVGLQHTGPRGRGMRSDLNRRGPVGVVIGRRGPIREQLRGVDGLDVALRAGELRRGLCGVRPARPSRRESGHRPRGPCRGAGRAAHTADLRRRQERTPRNLGRSRRPGRARAQPQKPIFTTR